MEKEEIKEIVRETINQLLGANMIKYREIIIVDEVGEMLKAHYKKPDEIIDRALNEISSDYYYGVLEGYYREGLTLDKLSQRFNADISTIQRNKKRLCITIHNIIN